jgi:uncharacterized LabA/DUF88 family protein
VKITENNVAYIDGANLYNGTRNLSWDFDYGRFRIWLSEKYKIKKAYLFLGLILKYADLYNDLRRKGYTLVFKEVIYDQKGKAKGNCDADIVVLAMKNYYERKFENVVLVSSDGDFSSLVNFLHGRDKLLSVISSYESDKCSILLKKTGVKISYIADQRNILEAINKKAPDEDETS